MCPNLYYGALHLVLYMIPCFYKDYGTLSLLVVTNFI